MRARTRGALATIARSVAVFVAIVAGAAAIGAVVGVLVWGEWFLGAGLAAGLAAWLALPIGTTKPAGGMLPTRMMPARPRGTQHPRDSGRPYEVAPPVGLQPLRPLPGRIFGSLVWNLPLFTGVRGIGILRS